ncbi:hypothetical protein [Haloarchaeobius sp. DFWS5]|uniref:hypothetical protein n=1 Tax=Haloarchaeobius sp. DFWS5 TaxID=3446114 RepID=UPI003EBE8037
MDYPRTSKRDIVDGEYIDMVCRVCGVNRFDNGDEKYVLEDWLGKEFDLKIWAQETDYYDIETDAYYLFERAEGDVFRGETMLGSNRGAMEAERLDEPPEFFGNEEAAAGTDWLGTGGIVAVDIETVSTEPEERIDLDDSSHVELLCIGVGYAPQEDVPGEVEVLFREGSSRDDEAALLDRFCTFVESRDPSTLVLYWGDFDTRHLRGRAVLASDDLALSKRVNRIFDDIDVVNLTPSGSLEDNADVPETHWDCYTHSLHPPDWRAEHPRYRGDVADPVVTNKDVPYFGERYLRLCDDTDEASDDEASDDGGDRGETDDRERRALHELLRHYTATDIQPLFELLAAES